MHQILGGRTLPVALEIRPRRNQIRAIGLLREFPNLVRSSHRCLELTLVVQRAGSIERVFGVRG
jgi:hypothetical protein